VLRQSHRDFDVCRRTGTAKTEPAADMEEIFRGGSLRGFCVVSGNASDMFFEFMLKTSQS